MQKVKLDVIKPWITTKITQILGMEDDVVVEFVINQLEEKVRKWNSVATGYNMVSTKISFIYAGTNSIGKRYLRSLSFFPSSYYFVKYLLFQPTTPSETSTF